MGTPDQEMMDRLRAAVEKTSERLSAMTSEERDEVSRKAFEKFTKKGQNDAEVDQSEKSK